ncbi:GD22809 [Drosophila simulans]|uniref:GD22809 n=1 Tax=Drosophila simulans TaxID=7240 RepID=B4Q8J4_DROSI|nr:GD22809 [Drosophila simulans]
MNLSSPIVFDFQYHLTQQQRRGVIAKLYDPFSTPLEWMLHSTVLTALTNTIWAPNTELHLASTTFIQLSNENTTRYQLRTPKWEYTHLDPAHGTYQAVEKRLPRIAALEVEMQP